MKALTTVQLDALRHAASDLDTGAFRAGPGGCGISIPTAAALARRGLVVRVVLNEYRITAAGRGVLAERARLALIAAA
jgi:hypothetical protein